MAQSIATTSRFFLTRMTRLSPRANGIAFLRSASVRGSGRGPILAASIMTFPDRSGCHDACLRTRPIDLGPSDRAASNSQRSRPIEASAALTPSLSAGATNSTVLPSAAGAPAVSSSCGHTSIPCGVMTRPDSRAGPPPLLFPP